MARNHHASVPASLWSALGAFFVTTTLTVWNVIANTDPDTILFRAVVSWIVIFLTILAAQIFARVTARSATRRAESLTK